jgi:ribosomal protein L3
MVMLLGKKIGMTQVFDQAGKPGKTHFFNIPELRNSSDQHP